MATRQLEAQRTAKDEIVTLKHFTFYVQALDGTVHEVAPASALRLTNTEVLFLLGELVVERWPRSRVYCASQSRAALPALIWEG
jgi:hypothetical protein